MITGSRLEPSHSHLSAEFLGVPNEQLCDAKLLGGLLIAAGLGYLLGKAFRNK